MPPVFKIPGDIVNTQYIAAVFWKREAGSEDANFQRFYRSFPDDLNSNFITQLPTVSGIKIRLEAIIFALQTNASRTGIPNPFCKDKKL
jgi:hypothetical protein